MARPLRIEYEGAFYHVMNRGSNRQNIFLKKLHWEIFLDLLEDISIKFFVEIHAFCLMNNHYHLLVRTPIANLGKAMRHLDGLYTRRFNIDEGRDGSIFRGRYKSILIEEEAYLLQVSRYIHLNPVEAGLCQNADDYVWSSYPSFINKKIKKNWLVTDLILSHFENFISYEDYIKQGVDECIKNLYHKESSIFGSEEFINTNISMLSKNQKKFCFPDIRKTRMLPGIQKISESVAAYYSVNVEDLKDSERAKLNLPRKIAILFAKRYGQCSHQEISDYFGCIAANSISTLISRLEEDIVSSKELQMHVEKITRKILGGNV